MPHDSLWNSTLREVPLFVRYLKLVTDKEGRADDFTAFYAKCKDGLTVPRLTFFSCVFIFDNHMECTLVSFVFLRM